MQAKKRLSDKNSAPNTTLVSPAYSAPQLMRLFLRLLPSRQLEQFRSLQNKTFYQRMFTPLVSLWYLVFQRLQQDPTLDAVVADAQDGGADRLCRGLSQKIRSVATASYSNARQRLPLAFVLEALQVLARQIRRWNSQAATWHGMSVILLDGTTVRLRPHGDIPEQFPPLHNQSKTPSYWCLMRVVVGFCARTATALDCTRGSMHQSEQTLACQLIVRQPAKQQKETLYIGDRNFGVFRIVQTARSVGAHVLVRMTRSRARKLLGRSLHLGEHSVRWSATRHDQLQPDCSQDPIDGRLLVLQTQQKGFRSQTLYLFTTLARSSEYDVEELARLYGVRWHIELNLRYLKAQMGLKQLECKSADMAQKEWIAGLMAYNLIRAAMFAAALRGSFCPLELSFSSSRRHLIHWLARWGLRCRGRERTWERMLDRISQCHLPHRRKPRPSEPRLQRHLRENFPPLIGCRKKARQQLTKHNQKS